MMKLVLLLILSSSTLGFVADSVDGPVADSVDGPVADPRTQFRQRRLRTEPQDHETDHSDPFICVPGTQGPKCSYRGICREDGLTCHCDKGFATFDSVDGNQCNYEQKGPFGIWLLEFFFGPYTGAGYFQAGRIGLGVGQLMLFWGGIIFMCVMACCAGVFAKGNSVKYGLGDILGCVGGCFIVCWILGILVWWIYALVTFAQGSVADGNGVSIPSP